ncbi:MAG: GAF domain-containing protein [Anaerolineaceae bacterium]|jgi:serine phosphatase RsbU (regulator of sigma subunit)/putative methionine-R-sulfoxide reductase with GAF domain/anti-sigma regulatory factor (Ser/Thr protein kinase)|nr:GAF domain-containing protein [Anaerolineaceae bacterium]
MPTQTFPGYYENLEKIADFVRQHARQAGFGETALYAIETAVDEACSNIIEHGYGGEGKGDIECCCEFDETSLTITLTDQGKPFNPSEIDMPNLNVPLDQRKAHGLGLYFMHQMMDEVSFKYKEGEGNILTMIKYYEADICEPDTRQPGSDPEWQHLLRLGETLLKNNTASIQANHIETYVSKLLTANAKIWLAQPHYPLPGQPDTETIPEDAAPFLVQQAMMTGQVCYRNKGDQDGTNCARMEKPLATTIPLIAQEKLLAVLEVQRLEGPPLCLEEMNELHRLSAYVSIILQITRQETIKRWRDEQLALVRSVSTQIANEHDLDELCRRVTELIRETFNYYHVAVFTLNEKEDLLEFRAEANPGETDYQRTVKTLHLNQGIVGHVANTGQELIARDVHDEPLFRHVDGLPDTVSEAALPLIVEGKVLGVLDIQSDRLDTFHETDMTVLRALANSIALAVEDARLYSDLKWQAEQTRMVFEVSHKLTSILELDKLLEAVVTMIRSHFGYPFVHVFTVHNTRRRVVYQIGSGARSQAMRERELEYDLENPKGIIPWVARTGKIRLVNDASKDPLFVPTDFPPTNTQAELCIPLIYADSVLGVLDIQSTQVDAFDEKQIPLLEALAANISTAIRNANLYRSERWRRQVGDSFRDVAGLLSSNADLNTLLDTILSELGRNLPCDASAIWLLDSRLNPEGNPCMNLAAVQGIDPARLQHYCLQEDVRVWLDQMLASREPVIRQEEDDYDPLGAALEMPANYSSITTPLYIGDQPLGAITLVHHTPGRYGTESQAMTTTFASYGAMAIRNARLYGDAQNQAWISTVLLQIAEASQAVESLEDLLATTVRITPLLVGVEMCAIFLWEENRQSFIFKDQYNLQLPPGSSPVFDRHRAPALGQLAATREITFLEDLHNDLGIPAEIEAPDDQTMILLPLQVRDSLLGALLVVHHKQGQADASLSYAQQTLSILQGITRQTSLALENQLLLEARQEEGYITAVLLQVSQAVANQNELIDILDTIVHLMTILVGINGCAIYRREESGNFTPLQAHTGSRQEEDELMQTIFAPGTFKTLDEVFEEKRIVFCPLGEDVDFAAWAGKECLPDLPSLSPALLPGSNYLLGFPVIMKDEFYGVLVAREQNSDAAFRPRRMELITGITQQIALAIQNEHFQQEMVLRERMEQEFSTARTIQQTFLPDRMPELEGWEIDAHWITAREVGGDFYDIIRQDDHRLGLVIADVADKGMPAALYMTVTRTLVRAVTHGRTSPAEVLQRVNNLLAMDAQNGMFITVFYAILDLTSGTLTFSNAGHNKPLVLRHSSGKTEVLPKGGMALAVLEDIELQDHTLSLEEGDCLLCYTDGVTEAFSPDEEMFGERRLETLLASLQGQTIHDILDTVIKVVTDFRGEREISDDVTLLGIRREISL